MPTSDGGIGLAYPSTCNRKEMIQKKWIYVVTLVVLGFQLSCEQEENLFERPAPEINSLVEVTVFKQEVGLPVDVSVELRAINGLDQLVVRKDGELFDQVQYPEDQLIASYTLDYEVENVPDGTLIVFDFIITDQRGEESEVFSFTVEVGPPFTIESGTRFNTEVQIIKGRINRNITLSASNTYLMDSIVSVEGNRTLTIEAGTTILMKTFEGTVDSRLSITQGSRIIAGGTKDAPIVFTSDLTLNGTEDRGDWSGIFIYGRAPTNQGATVFEEGFLYGGTQENDNSGSLKYVRIEYAGKNDDDGIHFFGVGAGTQLSYIQVFRSEDNAFRFKGGTADLKYIVGVDHAAYGIWAEHGWRGRGQFWVFQTTIAATNVPVTYNNQARSVELRNDPNDFLLQPATYTQIANITAIGNGNTTEFGTRRGLRVRRGAMGIIQNVIITNFPDDGVRVENVPQENLDDGTMTLANVRSFSNRENYDEQAEDFFLPMPEFNVTEESVPGITPENFVGSVPSDFDPASLGSWFTSAPYIGAIENEAGDWTADGTWCKNPDGTIR